MDHTKQSLKVLANRLAQGLVADEGAALMENLAIAGLLAPSHDSAQPGYGGSAAALGANATCCVGIWERSPDQASGAFTRQKRSQPEWNLWANVARIEPKSKKKKRVVLIGESVARGYLYDPQFNPAMVLENSLQAHFGAGAVEVIDLARTNLKWEIGDLARHACLLEPDAVVIFAGNNWNTTLSDPVDLPYLDVLLREHGPRALKQFMEERLAAEAANLVTSLSTFYEVRNVPLVWMVPEFNLGDWRDAHTMAPALPDNTSREWVILNARASKAFAEGDLQLATELATLMLELDGGVNPAAHYLLADCALAGETQDFDTARRHLEMARDAAIWDASRIVTPRAYTVTQNAIRYESANNPHTLLVDLPQIFKEHTDGRLPDRKLFLDFCHLTASGIEIAMKAAASAVNQALKVPPSVPVGRVAPRVAPSAQTIAESAFLAAIHNAHHHQAYDLVHYYCRQSVQAWPAIVPILRAYLDLQTRKTPMLMCKSAETLTTLGSPLIPNYLLRKNVQQLDRVLLDAIAQTLEERGIAAETQLGQLRRAEHSVEQHGLDLLDYYYCSSTSQVHELMWSMPSGQEAVTRKRKGFYRAFAPVSRFLFVADGDQSLALALTCRLPGQPHDQQEIDLRDMRVLVNDLWLPPIAVSHRWTALDIFVPVEAVKPGINEVSIYWPAPQASDQPRRPADGIQELFTIYGEIHTFTVSANAQQEADETDAEAWMEERQFVKA